MRNPKWLLTALSLFLAFSASVCLGQTATQEIFQKQFVFANFGTMNCSAQPDQHPASTVHKKAKNPVQLKKYSREQCGIDLPLVSAKSYLSATRGHEVPSEQMREDVERMAGSYQSAGRNLNAVIGSDSGEKEQLAKAEDLRRAGNIPQAVLVMKAIVSDSDKLEGQFVEEESVTRQKLNQLTDEYSVIHQKRVEQNKKTANYWKIIADLAFSEFDRKEGAAALEHAVDVSGDGNPVEQFSMLENAGVAWMATGNPERALKVYQRCLSIAVSETEHDDSNLYWKRALANAYSQIGYLEQNKGNLHAALTNYKQSINVLDDLTQKDPEDFGAKNMQVLYLQNLVNLEKRMGETDAANADLLVTREKERKIAVSNSRNGIPGVEKNTQLYWLSQAKMNLHDYPAAEDSIKSAIVYAEENVTAHPGDINAKDSVVFDYQLLASIEEIQGRSDDVIKTNLRVLQVLNELIPKSPSGFDFRFNRVCAYSQMARHYERMNNLSEASQNYTIAIRYIKELVTTDPDQLMWREQLGFLYQGIGNVQSKGGDLPSAIASYQAGTNALDELHRADPTNTDRQMFLGNQLASLAQAQLRANRLDDAVNNFKRGLEIGQSMATQSPNDEYWRNTLGTLVSFFEPRPTEQQYQLERDRLLGQCEVNLHMMRQRVRNPEEIDKLIDKVKRARFSQG